LNPADCDDFHEMLLRLFMATLLGGFLGIDRELHRKPAGVRVLSLVSMGAAAIAILSVTVMSGVASNSGDGVLRTVQGVLSGIGFLGAGVIVRAQGRDDIHGLTTAASIWVSSILGMICGVGQWKLATCAFLLAWGIMTGGRWVETQIVRFTPPPVDPSSPATKKIDYDNPS
jgi:putative Mg2+ transporter-C (MgtC) family protein